MYPGRWVAGLKPTSVNVTVYPSIYRVEGFKPTSVNVTVYPGRYRVEEFKPTSVNVVTVYPELKTLEWDILNPDRIINLEIKN